MREKAPERDVRIGALHAPIGDFILPEDGRSILARKRYVVFQIVRIIGLMAPHFDAGEIFLQYNVLAAAVEYRQAVRFFVSDDGLHSRHAPRKARGHFRIDRVDLLAVHVPVRSWYAPLCSVALSRRPFPCRPVVLYYTIIGIKKQRRKRRKNAKKR